MSWSHKRANVLGPRATKGLLWCLEPQATPFFLFFCSIKKEEEREGEREEEREGGRERGETGRERQRNTYTHSHTHTDA